MDYTMIKAEHHSGCIWYILSKSDLPSIELEFLGLLGFTISNPTECGEDGTIFDAEDIAFKADLIVDDSGFGDYSQHIVPFTIKPFESNFEEMATIFGIKYPDLANMSLDYNRASYIIGLMDADAILIHPYITENHKFF